MLKATFWNGSLSRQEVMFLLFFTCAAGAVKIFRMAVFGDGICMHRSKFTNAELKRKTQLLQAQVSRVFPVTIVRNCMVIWMERKRLSFSRLLYERLLYFAFLSSRPVAMASVPPRAGFTWRDRCSRQTSWFVRVPSKENLRSLSRTWRMSRAVCYVLCRQNAVMGFIFAQHLSIFKNLFFALRPHKSHSVCQCSYHN